MANGRREHEYDVAIDTVSFISKMFNGRFDPRFSNPYRDLDMIPPTTDEEAKEGWDLVYRWAENYTKELKGEM